MTEERAAYGSSTGLPDDRLIDAMFKALASRPRREILALLASGAEGDERCCGAGEVCACDFAERLGLGAPTVSHHMKALVDAQLVSAEKRGLWVYYRLRPESVRRLIDALALLSGCDLRCE